MKVPIWLVAALLSFAAAYIMTGTPGTPREQFRYQDHHFNGEGR